VDGLPVICIIFTVSNDKFFGILYGIFNFQGLQNDLQQGCIKFKQEIKSLHIKGIKFILIKFEKGRMTVGRFYTSPMEFLPFFLVINSDILYKCFVSLSL